MLYNVSIYPANANPPIDHYTGIFIFTTPEAEFESKKVSEAIADVVGVWMKTITGSVNLSSTFQFELLRRRECPHTHLKTIEYKQLSELEALVRRAWLTEYELTYEDGQPSECQCINEGRTRAARSRILKKLKNENLHEKK